MEGLKEKNQPKKVIFKRDMDSIVMPHLYIIPESQPRHFSISIPFIKANPKTSENGINHINEK